MPGMVTHARLWLRSLIERGRFDQDLSAHFDSTSMRVRDNPVGELLEGEGDEQQPAGPAHLPHHTLARGEAGREDLHDSRPNLVAQRFERHAELAQVGGRLCPQRSDQSQDTDGEGDHNRPPRAACPRTLEVPPTVNH